MASPFTAYFAGIGTVVAALAVGFGGALMLTSPLPSQKEQKSAYEKRIEANAESRAEKPAEPAAARPDSSTPVNPNVTPAVTSNVYTNFSPPAAPAPWPSAVQSAAQETPKPAPDAGALQPPVRPAAPQETVASAPPAQLVVKPRDGETSGQAVSNEWKKKEKRDALAQRKSQRKQNVVEQAKPEPVEAEPEDVVVETRTITTYAPEQRPQLGIFNLLLGGN